MENDRNILSIYKKYKILPNLQEHMLKVAAVADIICDSWQGDSKLDKENIVLAALLHDMGNIIKIRLNHLPGLVKAEDLEYWEEVKIEFIEKYGTDEHKATLEILKELNVDQEVLDLVNNIGHIHFCDQLLNGDFYSKIINYADTRVGPFGIISYADRMAEVSRRYSTYENYIGDEKHNKAVACGVEVEGIIFKNCKINPEDITEDSAQNTIENLRHFVIK